MFDINIPAVLTAAAVAFALGGLWYGPLFGKAWMRAFNFTEADLAKGNMPLIYAAAFVFTLIPAGFLDILLDDHLANAMSGAVYGLAAGLVFAAPPTATQYLFEGRPLKAFVINAGYSVLALTVMGAIVGAW